MQNDLRHRILTVVYAAAVLALGMAVEARAQGRSLPSEHRIELAQSDIAKLTKTLPLGEQAVAALTDEEQSRLVGLPPESSRKSCGDLVETWGSGRNEAILTARWFHS